MTPERFARLRAVLARRQPDLTVLMERVNKSHNFSAILRSCDAVGVLEAHVVPPDQPVPLHSSTAAGSERWIAVQRHGDTTSAIDHLRGRGLSVLALHPDPDAVDFRDLDFTRPTALVLGAELFGISEEALSLADTRISIPMSGMVPSLNVSVAAAVVLYEAQRQRSLAGLYRASRLPTELFGSRLFEWAYPRLARRCREAGVPYPPVGESGDLIENPFAP